MKKGMIVTVIILLASFIGGNAQQQRTSLLLSISGSNPLGDFAEKIGQDPKLTRRFGFQYGDRVGLAMPGLGLGIELDHPVQKTRLSWVISAGLLLNATDFGKVESYFRHDLGDTILISFANHYWLNIPIFTGFTYGIHFHPHWRLFGQVQAGINLTREPMRKVEMAGLTAEETRFKLTPDFGFSAGLGLEWKKRYNLGVRYVNLGKPRYEGTRQLNEKIFTTIPKRVMKVAGDERPISMIVVYWGYRL